MKTPNCIERKLRECRKQELVRNAAPKLLEALEESRRFVDAYTDEDLIARSLIVKIDSAIATARGK